MLCSFGLHRIKFLVVAKTLCSYTSGVLVIPNSKWSSKVDKLFLRVKEKGDDTSNKISVIGAGQVGMSCVFALFTQNITNNVALVDMDEAKLEGEMLDMVHGSVFLNSPKVAFGTDYSVTAGSRICIITAGARGQGKSRLRLIQSNADILLKIVPQLIKYNPNTIIMLANNPVDTLTFATWKISGLPVNQVIGSGCNLDTARFRYFLGKKLGIAATAVHGYVIGEHGDSSVPVWSSVNVAGVRLTEFHKDIGTDEDTENWKELHMRVIRGAADVIKTKGYTSWAIALSLAQLCRAILTDSRTIYTVTTCVKGEHGIQDDVFLSLPCILGAKGIYDIVRQPLSDWELKMLRKSAMVLADAQNKIKF